MTTVADHAARHDEADISPVSIERSDAIDAAAGLLLLARHARRDAASRRSAGPNMAAYRAGQRQAADVYEAAARRVQRAADEALSAVGSAIAPGDREVREAYNDAESLASFGEWCALRLFGGA